MNLPQSWASITSVMVVILLDIQPGLVSNTQMKYSKVRTRVPSLDVETSSGFKIMMIFVLVPHL